jgi:hypothetical protein
MSEPSNNDGGADVPPIPAILGGAGNSLAFTSEMERSNYLRGGINVGAAYDDNALLTSTGQVTNTTYSVFPNIAIEQSTSRMRWSLGYSAGLTVNQRLSNRNHGSHDLRFDSTFRLSPHVNLRVAEDFSLIAGVFTNVGSGFESSQSQSNTTLITPLANTRSSQTVVETNYHYALKDIVGASGSFSDLHYSEVTTGSGSLVDTQTAVGTVFWQHELFHGNWGGPSYRFDRISFGSSGETRVHSFLAVDTFRFAKAFTLSGFVGPEYSDNHGVAATGPNAGRLTDFTNWSVAAGVAGGWQTQRTSLNAGYSKRISDGSGVLGIVRLSSVHGAWRQELHPGWDSTLSASYGNNQSLTLASSTTATTIKATSVGVSLNRNLGKSFGFQVAYSHDFQRQSGLNTVSQTYDANRNRVAVTLSYQWAQALGR